MTDEYQPRDQPSSSYDPKAWASPHPDDRLLNGDVAAVESGPPASSVTPPPFNPVEENRLFTAHDSIIGADCKVHPTARLSYDSLPQEHRDVFNNCRMYLEKHLEFVKYLHHLSLDDSEKKNEPSSERDLIKSLGISVPTEDKKKWQCGVVGCEYKGTLQHLVSHLRTKSHIGIPTFACTLDCKILFHHAQDRDRHVKEKICLKSRLVEDAAEQQGSMRSLRGVQDQTAGVPQPKVKSRAKQQLARGRGHQPPAQTSAHGFNDPGTRKSAHYDPRFQALGNQAHYNTGISSTSSAPPQAFATPLHLTHAYHQTNSSVPTTQGGHAGLHPTSHAPVTPDFFPMILPVNNGSMYAEVITNNNHVYGTAGNFQRTNNPQLTSGSHPVNSGFNHPTGPTSAYSGFDSRVITGYQDPGQPSTSHSVNFAGNFYDEDPPRGSHRRSRDSWQSQPNGVQNQGPSFRRDEDGGSQYRRFPRPPGPPTGPAH